MKKLTTAILLIALVVGNSFCKKDLVGEGPTTTEKQGGYAG